MPTKRDPLALVISYFTTVELAQLAQTLAIVKEIARSRLAPTARPKKNPVTRSRLGSTPGAGGAVGPVASREN